MSIVFLILAVIFFALWQKAKKQANSAEFEKSSISDTLKTTKEEAQELREQLMESKTQVQELSKYQGLIDVDAEIQKKRKESDEMLNSADTEAKKIISDAELHAKEIADTAEKMASKAKEFELAAVAMKNIIEGYGDQYVKPTYSLLDDLAEDFGYTEAGQQLKIAREKSARMVKDGTAASCDYAQAARKDTAIAFVIDAFNGKVDSILSKIKKDNYGTLEQKINDAYNLVNYNGRAFRNAVITPEYLSARLEELKWGVRTQALKVQAQEEQKRLREQMREEERARREYERAMKDAAKEEEMLRKAMEKAQKQIETATAANRAEYEAKLETLKQQLAEAEERGQRALSMAQQTKHGNVYVISNIGSFGENVYKVGMTRRLDPLDRVKELGDASVPFPFDVHAIIESDDAPTLETTLHKALALMQMNKVNPRKEFFKVMISDIRAIVEKMGLQTTWTIDAAAAEYRETLALERAMENDPDAKKRWEEYYATVSSNSPSGIDSDEDE